MCKSLYLKGKSLKMTIKNLIKIILTINLGAAEEATRITIEVALEETIEATEEEEAAKAKVEVIGTTIKEKRKKETTITHPVTH